MVDWFSKANSKQYWEQLTKCLLNSHEKLPPRPKQWNRRRRSTQNWNQPNIPRDETLPPNNNQPPPSPQCNIAPPPRRDRQSLNQQQDRDYIPDNVGRVMYNSLQIISLGFGSTETKVMNRFRMLLKIYHPDKHEQNQTGMTNEEAMHFFQLLNNAWMFLTNILCCCCGNLQLLYQYKSYLIWYG